MSNPTSIVVSGEPLLAHAVARVVRRTLGASAIVVDDVPPTAQAVTDLLVVDETVLEARASHLARLTREGLPLVVFAGTAEGRHRFDDVQASAYVMRSAHEDQLQAALEGAIDGISRVGSDAPVSSSTAPTDELHLTARERAIMRRLARGATTAEVAQELYVSPSTVKTQLYALYRKLGVSSRSEAVLVLASSNRLHLLD